MLANRYVPMYPRASSSQCHSPGRSQCSEEQHSSPNRQAEETLTLDNFMLKCVHSLPLRIVVEKGYFVCDERCSIATGDVYNVHFVKRNKVALLRDLGDKVYNIPLNSAIQFGPIFNPKGDLKAAMQGYRFERVSDVMAQIQLPKVILATKPHIRSNPKSSVEQYEILVVQKIVQTPMKKKALQVYSITRREQKMLDSDCLGHFTTDPYGSCLHLPDIIEHFSNEFPLEVQVVMKEASMPENIPYEITSEASFLTGVHTETSLVVSTTLKEDEDQKPIEIPVDLPIDVKVIQLEKAELERLYAYTRKLYERFDAFSTLSIKTSSSKLCTAVRSGFEREGVELQKPDSVYDTLIPSQSPVIPQRVNALATHNRSGPSTPLHPTPKPKLHSKQQQSPQAATGSAPADSKKGVRHNYTPLNILTPTKRKSYETCKPNLSSVRPSGSLTTTKSSEMGTTTNLIEFRKLLARVEMLEREVYALRSEIATLKSQGMSKYLVNFIYVH